MLRSLRNSLQTQPKASRSGAEGSKGLGGQEGHTLLFLQCCLVPLFHFLGFLPFCLSFSFLGPCHFLPIAGFVRNSERNCNSILYVEYITGKWNTVMCVSVGNVLGQFIMSAVGHVIFTSTDKKKKKH